MPLTINEEVRRTFELASLRREAKTINTPRQWREVSKMMTRCDDARTREKDLYVARYDSRVEVARRRLVNEAGRKSNDLQPRWATGDRFSPDATLRQAQRDVRAAHQARIERIDEIERKLLRALVQQFGRENAMRGLARESFDRAADRRTGLERRRPRGWGH
jgi:hypothetical protein